jgi:hypothetical protein
MRLDCVVTYTLELLREIVDQPVALGVAAPRGAGGSVVFAGEALEHDPHNAAASELPALAA